jgi:transposase
MKEKKGSNVLPTLYPNAAGIDISSKEHFIAVNPDLHKEPIRSFGGFTEDLYSIAKWLKEHNVDTVAMEATGVYWISLFLVLEEAKFDVILVNAKHVKNVRGKKTDASDAEWIRQLHSCGLLSASFQPDLFTRKLRTYMRHRKNLIEMSATHIRMMQKAFEQMNIKLQHVIADITGKSGQEIIKSIISGERDPIKLASICDGRMKAEKKDSIIKSLHGIWKEEHVFELEQSYSIYNFYKAKIDECDSQIEQLLLEEINKPKEPNKKIKPKTNKNNLNFEAKDILVDLTGTDLSKIFGITETTAIEIISEIGLDMNKWPTVKHFTSWLNLAPNNKISGGKILSSKIAKKKNKAGQVFKMAAYATQRSQNCFSVFYHRIKARKGVKKAITATARKIAVVFYNLIKKKLEFNPMIFEKNSLDLKTEKINRLKRQAQSFGFQLVST